MDPAPGLVDDGVHVHLSHLTFEWPLVVLYRCTAYDHWIQSRVSPLLSLEKPDVRLVQISVSVAAPKGSVGTNLSGLAANGTNGPAANGTAAVDGQAVNGNASGKGASGDPAQAARTTRVKAFFL